MDLSRPVEPRDLFSANGLVIVLTGGGTGIGLAMAAALKTAAKKVYILGRRLDKLQEGAKSIDADGKIVIPLQCDITDNASLKKVAEQVEQEDGYVDVVINNAGVIGPDHKKVHSAKSISEVQDILLGDWDGWAKTYAANTSAIVGVAATFLHLLDAGNKRRGFVMKDDKLTRDNATAEGIDQNDTRTSQIITVASIAGFNRYITAGLPYTSSKAGAIALSKSLATLLATWGIRSNAICPGFFPSEMVPVSSDPFPKNLLPAGRQGNFDDIAGTILYMVGQGGAYLNGAVQVIDGGRLSVMPGMF